MPELAAEYMYAGLLPRVPPESSSTHFVDGDAKSMPPCIPDVLVFNVLVKDINLDRNQS